MDIYTGRLGSSTGVGEVEALEEWWRATMSRCSRMGRDFAKKLKTIPTLPDNDSSVADYARTVAQLQSKTGVDFDKAYLQYEVA